MPNRTKTFSKKMPIRIKSLRKRDNYTQKELAEKLYKSESTVRMWELGKSEPDTQSINALSDIFSISTDYIIGLPYTITIPKENWHWSKIQDYNNADEALKEYLMYKYGQGIFESHGEAPTITEEEAAVIDAYRSQPEVQTAIKRILGINSDSIKIYTAASSKGNKPPQATEIPESDINRMKKMPFTDQDLK